MRRAPIWGLLIAMATVASGCATRGYVDETVTGQTTVVHTRIDTVEGQVEAAQTQLRQHDHRITRVSQTAEEALQRAQEAGALAEGKLLYETVLTDDQVRFGFDQAQLAAEARAALDAFAAPLVGNNRNVYIEIQGHTDSVGMAEYNERLGLERAEAVRRYLNMEHRIPLHRMAVISYGEAAPVADNGSREGRSQNRRVVLVVLE